MEFSVGAELLAPDLFQACRWSFLPSLAGASPSEIFRFYFPPSPAAGTAFLGLLGFGQSCWLAACPRTVPASDFLGHFSLGLLGAEDAGPSGASLLPQTLLRVCLLGFVCFC